MKNLDSEYSKGVEDQDIFWIPSTNREVIKTDDGWKSQPWNDNYWREFSSLDDAVKFATPVPCVSNVSRSPVIS